MIDAPSFHSLLRIYLLRPVTGIGETWIHSKLKLQSSWLVIRESRGTRREHNDPGTLLLGTAQSCTRNRVIMPAILHTPVQLCIHRIRPHIIASSIQNTFTTLTHHRAYLWINPASRLRQVREFKQCKRRLLPLFVTAPPLTTQSSTT